MTNNQPPATSHQPPLKQNGDQKMYQTLIQQAEFRQQDIAAWAAREQLARAATQGQISLFTRLVASLKRVFTQPQAVPATPVRASKQRTRTI